MYPIPAKCPVCGDDLYVERLSCVQCGTRIEGAFIPQRLAALTAEQWNFVELFVRSEGKLNRIQEELGLSYPTVRNRLHEVIHAMGYEVGDLPPEDDLMQTMLDELAEGKTTVDEVLKLMKN
jgi:hypothetical protein